MGAFVYTVGSLAIKAAHLELNATRSRYSLPHLARFYGCDSNADLVNCVSRAISDAAVLCESEVAKSIVTINVQLLIHRLCDVRIAYQENGHFHFQAYFEEDRHFLLSDTQTENLNVSLNNICLHLCSIMTALMR